MTNKIHKENKKEEAAKEVSEPKEYERPERHIKRVDFQKIEEAPLNQFEVEIQKKIAVMPSACDELIREENKKLLSEAIEHVSFSGREEACLKLALSGLPPPEIARKLGILIPSVHLHLRRAVEKIKAYLYENHD